MLICFANVSLMSYFETDKIDAYLLYGLGILCIAVKWYLKRDPKYCYFSIAQNKVNILNTYLNILISYKIFYQKKIFKKALAKPLFEIFKSKFIMKYSLTIKLLAFL